ncbi:MAG: low molecular weight protein-tyrosine-phosphatase [bacterium]
MTYRVTAVCLGNICRSPMAEAVIRAQLRDAGLDDVSVDSAGTGAWHVGNGADPRALQALQARGYALDHTARQIDASWLEPRGAPEGAQPGGFAGPAAPDLVVAMDWSNHEDLRRMGVEDSRLRMLRSFDPSLAHLPHGHGALEVPDPYYGAARGFDDVLDMLEAASRGLVDELRRSGVPTD